jgi:hypothetical protein
MARTKNQNTKSQQAETQPCHLRLPVPVYRWLQKIAAPEFKSVQQKIIEICLAAQKAEAQEQKAA